jgi:hypothetical protein
MNMERQIVEFILKTVVDSSTRTIWFYDMIYGEFSHVNLYIYNNVIPVLEIINNPSNNV